MLTTDEFPAAYLSTLTQQINNWLSDMIRTGQLPSDAYRRRSEQGMESTSTGSDTTYELGEHFLMVSMKDPEVYAVEAPDRDLGDLVTLTGRRHHQLKYKKRAVAYARSLVAKEEALCQLFATRLASHVEDAIAVLDKSENEIPEFASEPWRVRLLTIPTFHTHAFLIQKLKNGSDAVDDDSYVYVVSAPPWLDELPRERLLKSKEFLLGFRGKTPINGLREQR